MTTESPIRFQSAAEFKSRPNWRDLIDPAQSKLLRIIGDYALPKSEELACGLKGCRTVHQNGYVVAVDGGLETHIGNRCGNKFFHVNWGELQATFNRAAADRDRAVWLAGVLAEKDALVGQAVSLVGALSTAMKDVHELVDRFRKEPDLFSAFQRALKDGGRIRAEHVVDADTAERMNLPKGQRTYVENLGTIDAAEVAVPRIGQSGLPGDRLISQLRNEVLPTLNQLSSSGLRALNERQRKARSKELEAAKSILQESDNHLAALGRFLAPNNLSHLGRLQVTRPNQRTERFLRHFSNLAESG